MRIIYPPRPRGTIPPGQLDGFERRGKHLAQRKFNGHRNLIHFAPDGGISIYGRYGAPHRRYRMSRDLREELTALQFDAGKEYWLDSELLHPRVPNTVVIFDVLQAGDYLYGIGIEERLALMDAICGSP